MEKKARYPLGIQTFEKLIEGGYLYVDKTEYVYRLTHSDSSYVFLGRPRRFGKSLLASTLRAYFEGRRDLFQGLAIERLEKDWTAHPVLHFDISAAKHASVEQLEADLGLLLSQYEELYGRGEGEVHPNQRLMGLIRRASQQTGKKVVVIIDEYDAPLLDVMHDDDLLKALRQVMRNFYSPLKACDPYLRFVFLTGITKFSQLSIFSELNNLSNISMLKDYGAICGITDDEMVSQLAEGVGELAEELEMTRQQALDALKANYDGYHFAWPSPDIYNPFSLLNALANRSLDSYWFASGTPTFLIEMLRKFVISPSQLGTPSLVIKEDFDAPSENLNDIAPLLYQSGYITIKGYDKESKLYTLDIPNREIRIGLMHGLMGYYLGTAKREGNTTTALMRVALMRDDIDEMLRLLQKFLATIPQADYVGKPEIYEAHWQQMLYIIFSLLGAQADVEVRTAKGRVDLVARTASKLYLLELKLNKDATTAMQQINLKDYPQRFALCGLPIVKVGVNFDPDERNITEWKIE